MRDGISKHRCLLGVHLYELSTNYIYEIREKQKNPNDRQANGGHA